MTRNNDHALIAAVRKKRQGEGLSLRKLSEQIGVSYSTLSRLESGTTAPDTNTRVRLLTWLGEDSEALGLEHEKVAAVHFRAAKNVDSKTIECLLRVSSLVRSQFATKDF
jgi:transcriptional regulator with XRE-family HTH domain